MRGGAPLLRVERIECRGGLSLHHIENIPVNCMDIQTALGAD
jgi:hypothetical protein